MTMIIGSALSVSLFLIQSQLNRSADVNFNPSDPQNYQIIDDSFELKGTLYYPKNFDPTISYPSVILFHGLTGKRSHCADVAKSLQTSGFVCLTLDFRGHGDSGGTFPFDTPSLFNATFGDANGALRYLKTKSFVNKSAISAFGMSLGGGAALYMAISGFVSHFCAWYPGSAYILNNTPLYMYKVNSTLENGYIIQGTDDECSRCDPAYTTEFVNNNTDKVEVKWIEGGTHGTGVDYLTYKSETIAFFNENHEESSASIFYSIILNQYTPWICLGVSVLISAVMFIMDRKKRKI